MGLKTLPARSGDLLLEIILRRHECPGAVWDTRNSPSGASLMPGCNQSPLTLGGVPGKLVQVSDTDLAFERAVSAGATPVMPPADEFYGWRMGIVRDPFGHEWMIQHEVETISPEEMERRWADMMANPRKGCGAS